MTYRVAGGGLLSYEIHQGDCRDIARAMEPESVDLVIGDPPYGETSLGWDCTVPGWLNELPRIMKPSASVWIFGSLRSFMAMAGELADWNMAQDIVWEKQNGTNMADDRFKRVHEIVAQFYRGSWEDVKRYPVYTADARKRSVIRRKRPTHWGRIDEGSYESKLGGPRLARSVQQIPNCHGYAEHPTQKPERIIEMLLNFSCRPGDTMFDPFAGSGAVGCAAGRLGLNYIGSELDPEYAAMAKRRLANAELRGWREVNTPRHNPPAQGALL